MKILLLALGLLACGGARMESVTGTARNAKAGAIVVTDGGDALYVGGLGEWPAELEGRQVEVKGRVERKKMIPDPTVGPNGERSAGAEGDQTVIEGATWRPAP